MKRLLLLIILLPACEGDAPEAERAPATLPEQAAADDLMSCMACHPRQFEEWLGSSHNYGEGLDGTFQALELTANYYAAHVPTLPGDDLPLVPTLGKPLFRQNLLCTGCHAPSTAGYGANGVVDFNASLRDGAGPNPVVGRQLRRPEDGEDLLRPVGRAIEVAAATRDGADGESERRLSFQGITCDTCHKVGAPYEDRDQLDVDDCLEGEPADVCAQRQFDACVDESIPVPFDPACFRRSRGQHPHDPPFFEDHIATAVLPVERDGPVRYGPFPEGDAAPATAHEVSSGSTEYARNFNVARHEDGRPFEGQEVDERSYIQSSQFCGTCHDVRLPPLPENGILKLTGADARELDGQLRNHWLEPIHDEPFLRLENLYTEWFISPLNLHPDTQGDPSAAPTEQWPDNPYRNADGSARRLVCQDCHMSMFPYAPPGTFPGAYTHCAEGDEACGLTIATAGARSNLEIKSRPRVTTHNMTGVDIALGRLLPQDPMLQSMTTSAPESIQTGDGVDATFDLPVGLDARRRGNLEAAASISLAGTPQVLIRDDPDNCMMEANPEYPDLAVGTCNLPVKAWATNVNGGHAVASGFSQERQIWVELTVQDMGAEKVNGMAPVVDCLFADIDDLYTAETTDSAGRPTRAPKSHGQASADDLMDRLTGMMGAQRDHFHPRICRGLSGHLIDKPHDETHETEADGRLDDEDILLHRIGNTLPTFEDGRKLVSWHIADLGFDSPHDEVPLEPDRCGDQYDPPGEIDSLRVVRPDQFHIPGLNPFQCELTEAHLNPVLTATELPLPVATVDAEGNVTGVVPTPASAFAGANLTSSVTTTTDERLELLYPFPEYPTLVAHHDDAGHFHFGERFGLVYLTNIFYQTCGCEGGNCEGPETLDLSFGHLRNSAGEPLHPGSVEMHAQVPWLATYPTLPSKDREIDHHPLDDPDHAYPPEQYTEILASLPDPEIDATGTPYREAFTFIPLNADHMPNNRSLKFYEPQRHYWDIRVPPGAVGPIRVSVKMWYRHFPPEFLRLMARFTEGAYRRACAEGIAEDYFPNGPLVVEGEEMSARFPNAADIDKVQRVLLDEAVFFVDIGAPKTDARGRPAPDGIPPNPTFADDVAPIIENHCTPCHSDVLRHGGLILSYDDFPKYDCPAGAAACNQDPRANLVDVGSAYDERGRPLVSPGDPAGSLLVDLLTKSTEALRADGVRSRSMPLKTDGISPKEVETIRRWIEQGAN